MDIAITIVPTVGRAALVDFSHTVNYAAASYLIPMPDSTPNALAVVQPFSLLVFISTFDFCSITIFMNFRSIGLGGNNWFDFFNYFYFVSIDRLLLLVEKRQG